MEKRIDHSIVFEDNNILKLARNNWPKKGDIYRYKDSELFLVVETQPVYVKGLDQQ